jgi:hypothetical protein
LQQQSGQDPQPLLALNTLTVNAAMLDATGTIIGDNASWQVFADSNGMRQPDYGVDLNYLDFCGTEGHSPPAG